jgi:hypothetical protein
MSIGEVRGNSSETCLTTAEKLSQGMCHMARETDMAISIRLRAFILPFPPAPESLAGLIALKSSKELKQASYASFGALPGQCRSSELVTKLRQAATLLKEQGMPENNDVDMHVRGAGTCPFDLCIVDFAQRGQK